MKPTRFVPVLSTLLVMVASPVVAQSGFALSGAAGVEGWVQPATGELGRPTVDALFIEYVRLPSASSQWQARNLLTRDLPRAVAATEPAEFQSAYLVNNVVPEPGTILLLATGLFGLGLVFYLRRSSGV